MKILKTAGITLLAVFSVPLALYFLWLGIIVFVSTMFGGIYIKNMQTDFLVNGKKENISSPNIVENNICIPCIILSIHFGKYLAILYTGTITLMFCAFIFFLQISKRKSHRENYGLISPLFFRRGIALCQPYALTPIFYFFSSFYFVHRSIVRL